MIRAVFHRAGNGFCSVTVSGHAGFARHGSDIVCAGVTSAVQMAANGITEVLRAPAQVDVREDSITIALTGTHPAAADMLAALHLQLALLAEQYTKHVTTTILEV